METKLTYRQQPKRNGADKLEERNPRGRHGCIVVLSCELSIIGCLEENKNVVKRRRGNELIPG